MASKWCIDGVFSDMPIEKRGQVLTSVGLLVDLYSVPKLRQSQSRAGGLKLTYIRAFMAAMFGFTFFPVGDPKKSLHIYIYIYGTH